MSQCKINNWVTDGVLIAFQITFVFAFLTVFFFVYVQKVEQDEFVSQVNLIVDNIMKDFENNNSNLIHKLGADDKKNTVIIINGVIDVLREKIVVDGKSTVEDVSEKNHIVKLKALKSLISAIIILVIIATIVLLIGFCVPVQYYIKEAMLVLIFVGFTEFIFLEVIAKHYISASPNKIKRSIGQAIQKWIRDNHKV